jgi:hypothetical protein
MIGVGFGATGVMGLGAIVAGAVGSGASGSDDWANAGALSNKAPDASNPAFKIRPPSAEASPAMPAICLRDDE